MLTISSVGMTPEGLQMYEFARTDLYRLIRQESGLIQKLGVMLFNPGLHAVLLYRISRWFHLHHMKAIAALINYFNSVLTGAQISPRAIIGKGLVIYHPQGTVIGASAVIGNYCTLAHGNTIGQLYGDDDRPIIGDYFHAGPGARILGKIKIGNNVRVGANAVVIDSLPDGVTASIPPAKIIVRAALDPRTATSPVPPPSRKAILQRMWLLLSSTLLQGRDVPLSISSGWLTNLRQLKKQ